MRHRPRHARRIGFATTREQGWVDRLVPIGVSGFVLGLGALIITSNRPFQEPGSTGAALSALVSSSRTDLVITNPTADDWTGIEIAAADVDASLHYETHVGSLPAHGSQTIGLGELTTPNGTHADPRAMTLKTVRVTAHVRGKRRTGTYRVQ